MNRIKQKLQEDKKILSIYFTAGYPALNDTVKIIQDLEKSGVDLIEIGLPFSDPLADGPTIQASSTAALKNGMTTTLLFEQLKDIRKSVSIPLILMGYFNPVLQYGVETFCQKCEEIGIDGLILPDLPLDVYQEEYETIFKRHGLINVFLITPQTSDTRIKAIDDASEGFIYMVSSASTTGAKEGFGTEQASYFERIAGMNLKNPQIVGFGISNAQTFQQATAKTKGAIIGSAFIKHLTQNGVDGISDFVGQIR
ncbi:tryptophan synthase subunit alpha [Flagellimonas taeanensis]|uniref:tryptophan synthase subunit alpha n=1 Tax=Flavobacteriaceae TaxID=49546 RepID=UPI000E68C404|nr:MULTISPECIES: tryptophan synthase subunit alpha [Allomuricauda]MDC6384406.1 tryptophan synthase subunit alpha [Muricauda sp. SK9]RIV49754.1 tryptophan synthase subunit alpha [Allomuricauda taeanensis]RIV53953.1 tryptophan synthase subunit alpha [Allomuricauda taeanensis]